MSSELAVQLDTEKRLRRKADADLAALSPQRALVAELLVNKHLDWHAALREAGYSENKNSRSQTIMRLRQDRYFMAAVESLKRARDAESAGFDRESVAAFLEQMIRTTPADVCEITPEGVPIGLRSIDAIPAARLKSFRKLKATVRRSSKGQRARNVALEFEMVDVRGLVELLCKLKGWAEDSPLVVQEFGDVLARKDSDPADAPSADYLADALLDDRELELYERATETERGELLRLAAQRLRAKREGNES